MRFLILKKIFFVICFILFSSSVQAAIVMHGNLKGNSSQSFSFSVLPHVFNTASGTFYVAANEGTTASALKYVISKADRTGEFGEYPQDQGEEKKIPAQLTSMLLHRVALDGSKKVTNPLRRCAINYLSLLSDKIIAVTNRYPAAVFFINTSEQYASTLPNPLKDSEGNQAARVVGLSSNNKSFIFAAVAPEAGFGQPGSGIALINKRLAERRTRKRETDARGKVIKETFQRTPYVVLEPVDTITGQARGNNPVAINPSTAALKIGSDLTIIGTPLSFYWDDWLQRLYIGLQLTGGAGVSDGVRAIAIGRLAPKEEVTVSSKVGSRRQPFIARIVLDALVPADAITGTDQIVGARASNAQVSIHKLATMHTSTLLHYLIVAGGTGSVTTTGNYIYAVPLIDKNSDGKSNSFPNDEAQGTLADYSSIPQTYVVGGRVVGRGYTSAATNASQLLTASSARAVVGRGALPLAAGQSLSDLVVAGDSVFASVSFSYETGAQPGIYESQAIFDQYGRVVNWTPWQRVAGTDAPIFGFSYDSSTGFFLVFNGK